MAISGKLAAKLSPQVRQYLDFQNSITRLCGGDGENNPWSEVFPCISGTSQIAMRWGVRNAISNPDGLDVGESVEVFVRQVDGIELLQLTGVALQAIKGTVPTHDVASAMAANPFNAFAAGPCLLAAVAALSKKDPPTPASPEEAGVSDDDGRSDG